MNKLSFLLFVFSLWSIFGQAQNPKRFTEGGKVGYKDAKGRVIIPAKYDGGGEYIISGRVPVLKSGKVGLIDTNDKILVPIEYDAIRPVCSTPELASVLKDGKWGVVELGTNKIIIPFQYEGIGEAFIPKIRGIDTTNIYDIKDGGWIPAKENGKWGFISMANNKETKFLFDDVDPCCNDIILTVGEDKAFIFRGRAKHLPAVLLDGQWLEVVYDEKKQQLTTIQAKMVAKRGDWDKMMNNLGDKKDK